MSKSDIIELTVHLHFKTDKAMLVSDDGDEKKAVWLPLSQVEYKRLPNSANLIEVQCPDWLAKERGLI